MEVKKVRIESPELVPAKTHELDMDATFFYPDAILSGMEFEVDKTTGNMSRKKPPEMALAK